MVRILSSPKKLCDGVTRRQLLLTSGLGMCGRGLRGVLRYFFPDRLT